MSRRDDSDSRGGDGRRVRRDDNGPANKETSAEMLAFIERVEKLEEEKANINTDIKDVYGEAKSRGYDTKTLREIVKIRKKDVSVREEEEMLLHTYMSALGMI